nr:RsfA family transcriptional regulator [Bacilli bacterium]
MEVLERLASRSDAWTPEDDVKLAELVLRHIREGSTQLIAFEEAASLLGRTAAACGYRWNGVVRRHYDHAVKEAKQIRRTALEDRRHRRPQRTAITLVDNQVFTLDYCIRGLRDFEQRLQELEQENAQLIEEKRELEALIERNPPQPVFDDSQTLLAIMEKARRLIETERTRTSLLESQRLD